MVFASSVVKVCHSGGGETNILVQLDGIPTQFFATIGLFDRSLKELDDPCAFPESVRLEMVEKLANFLGSYQSTPLLKELVFHFLAKMIRVNHRNFNLSPNPDIEIFLKIFAEEMKILFEREKARQPPGRTLSTYLQSLFELTSAWSQASPGAASRCDLLSENFVSVPQAVLSCLESLSEGCPIKSSAIAELSPRKVKPACHSRMLVLSGIPKHLKTDHVRRLIKKCLDKIGGTFMNEIFVPDLDSSNDSAKSMGQNNLGFAVVEVRARRKLDDAKVMLEGVGEFRQHGELDVADQNGAGITFAVSKVGEDLACDLESCHEAWKAYLKQKLIRRDGKLQLEDKIVETLKNIFESGNCDQIIPFEKVVRELDDNLLLKFLKSLLKVEHLDAERLEELSPAETSTEGFGLDSLLGLVLNEAQTDPISVMKGLMESGFDLQLNSSVPDTHVQWRLKEDAALVSIANWLALAINVPPLQLHPTEIVLSEELLQEHPCLQEVPLANARCRFAIIQAINDKIETVLDLTDLRPDDDPLSNASVIERSKSVIFYDVKSRHLDKVINSTCTANPELPPPSILVNPVDSIGRNVDDVKQTWFYQSLIQLGQVSTLDLCAPIATGSDPQYPFLVKMSGETVEGNTGSFRHLLAKLVEELHGPVLSILMPYMGEGSFKGRYILRPGPVTLADEQLLQHFGKIIGFGLRSGIPLPLDLVPTFWKSLLGEAITDEDLAAFDPVLSRFIRKIRGIKSESKFNEFLEENQFPLFTCSSLRGDLCDLVENGAELFLSWDNRKQFVKLLREFRLREMTSEPRTVQIRAGLATIAPVNVLTRLFSADEAELKICGQSKIDVEVLKRHTIYQVGLSPTDQHIQVIFFVPILQ